jgi:alpha-mannosidase
VQSFRYLLVPHAGDWRDAALTRRAAELGSPVRAMLESFHDGALPPEASFVSDGGGRVMVSAVKGSEDDADGGAAGDVDLVVRAFETTGRPARARIELPLLGRTIEADFGPSQIRTFRVPRGGDAVEVDLVEWSRDDLPGGALTGAPGPDSQGPPAPPLVSPGAVDRHDASDATTPAEATAPAQRSRGD